MAAERAYKYDMGYAVPERRPEIEKQPEKRPELRKVKKDKIEALISSEKATNRKLLKVTAFMSVILVMFAVVCNSFSVRDRARTRYENIQEDYVFSQSQNREMKVKLNNLVSAVNIDEIAVNRLGLVKATAGSEIYLDTSDGNKVILSQDKNG